MIRTLFLRLGKKYLMEIWFFFVLIWRSTRWLFFINKQIKENFSKNQMARSWKWNSVRLWFTGTRNWSKHQLWDFIKITSDTFPKYVLFKVEVLHSGYLNQYSDHEKLALKPIRRIVKTALSVCRDNVNFWLWWPSWMSCRKNSFSMVRISSIFTTLFSTPDSSENRWKSFCNNLFKVIPCFDSSA